MRSLRNISMVEATIKEPVVANNATASTVAFIAPGPPNPPITQVRLFSIFFPLLLFTPSPPSLKLLLSESFHFLPSSSLYWQLPPTSPLLGQLSIERRATLAARAHPTPPTSRP